MTADRFKDIASHPVRCHDLTPYLTPYLNIAKAIIVDAAAPVKAQANRHVAKDLDRDVKLDVDHQLHHTISKQLMAKTPWPVFSEEGNQTLKDVSNSRCWILDPLDGSLNYSRGIPLNCISLALWEKDAPLMGIVYDFIHEELFLGLVSVGATLNNQAITMNHVSSRKNAVLCTGFPTGGNFDSASLSQFVQQIQDFKKVRLLGSAALSLAYVACGRADMYEEKDIALWDVAGGLALVKAAGGMIEYHPSDKTNRYHVRAGWGQVMTADRLQK